LGILSFLFGENVPKRNPRAPSNDAPGEGSEGDACPLCGGTGVIPDTNLDGDTFMDPCASCGGTGSIET
jgi:DnaJ-class molecular chaperone